VPRVRSTAAAARAALLEHAAHKLGKPTAQVKYQNGLFSAGSGQQVSLADLAGDEEWQQQFAAKTPQGDVQIMPAELWSMLGASADKVDGRAIVTGAAKYPSDVIRPGMLYGKVLRPVAYGATLATVDTSAAREMEGVTVVRDGGFVGCTAPTSWAAAKALDAIAETAKWEQPPQQPSSKDLFRHLRETARESRGGRFGGRGGERNGEEFERAMNNAAQKFEAEYTIAYIQHAPMEPRTAVAQWEGNRLTVWTGSQQPSRVQQELAQTFRLSPEQVRVIVPDTGGGFGGKHTGEAAVEAARLSKAAGKPVHLRWTREEEFTWAYFRPAGVIDVKAGLDASGSLAAWDFTNYNSGGSAIETPYRVGQDQTRQVGKIRTRVMSSDSPLRQGSYRALASTANTFAREAAIDELAQMAKADPLEFRLKHLEDGRLKDVLQAAAEKFGWNRRRRDKQPNRGIGLACGTEKGSFTAACVEVEVRGQEIRVLEACQAFECGAIHNPQNLRSQVTGCLMMGLGGALFEQIEFAGGQISNPQFSSYRVPRMSDLPEIDVVLLDRKDLPSVGAGETPIIAIAPAVANAVAQATGQRCRSMPMMLS